MSAKELTSSEVRDKVIHILKVYPCLSATMIQVGIGPQISPKIWRPVLQNLIAEGTIRRDEVCYLAPSGRYQSYSRYHLTHPASKE